ncbi:hypothetical protein ACHAWX_006817 [Stephanocyclus meneghinianus]
MEKLIAANCSLKIAHDAREREYKAEIDELEKEEQRLLDCLKKLDQDKHDVAKANGDVDVADNDLVEINAGGKVIAVVRSTLTHFKGTRLEALFSGRWDKKLQRDSAGHIYLDVNPVCFQAIIDYLNEVKISTVDSPAAPPSVDSEYQNILMHQIDLFGLSDIVFPHVLLLDSTIIRKQYHEKLHDWLSEVTPHINLTLLYRSSRDGRCDSTFHSKCDNKGATLTVIMTTEGHIVGAYSDVDWHKGSRYVPSNTAFLFVIPACDDSAASKMKLTGHYNQHAIYCSPYGPTFGQGHDLHVQRASLYLNTGNTYELAPSQLAGSCTFNIKDMEVFQVITESHSASKPKTSKINQAAKKRGSGAYKNETSGIKNVNRFSFAINTAINEKWAALAEVTSELTALEESFKDEGKFVKFFSSGQNEDIIPLNVCGTTMTTTRQTLQLFKDSVLASKILNAEQDDSSTNQKPVKEWNSEDVIAWLNSIEGLPSSFVKSFEDDEVTGLELLALGKEDLVEFGVTKRGTTAYILSEIKKLARTQVETVVLIEHSPYCFEKIIDYLRVESMFVKGLVDKKPEVPTIRASEKSRFEKVVKHYFPGDSSKFLLG